MKTFKEHVDKHITEYQKMKKNMNEDAVGGAGTAMSMGAGPQGLGSAQGAPIAGYDKLLGNGKMLRRKALDLLSKRRKGM